MVLHGGMVLEGHQWMTIRKQFAQSWLGQEGSPPGFATIGKSGLQVPCQFSHSELQRTSLEQLQRLIMHLHQ